MHEGAWRGGLIPLLDLLLLLLIFFASPWVCMLEMGASESVWWGAVAGVPEG